ncbi:MAG TPA: TAXI family TRAP transporter solute-binding subunit [Rhizomicrobium sp.]|nr:TAXI family TRAP transporter solute-binding subunit [Rhizomicrobium sp.]
MMPRGAPSAAVGAGLALSLLVAGPVPVAAQPARIAFQIATGSTGGTYFPVGEAIAGLLSHPAGAQRCDKSIACGPPGLIVTARTSDGTVANVRAVEAGLVTSGLAQSDVVALAVAGTGPFKKDGPLTHIRVIAALFPEDIHLVVAADAKIAAVAGLKKKRVSLGAVNSGNLVTARAVLAAWRIRERNLKTSFDPPDIAAQKLARHEIDAFFFVGGPPVPLLQSLLANRQAVLVPLDGAGRTRLLKAVPGLAADAIPAGTYPGIGKIETVRSRAVWIVNDNQPANLIYEMTRALFDPGNLKALNQTNASGGRISLDMAARDLPAPLHPGAAKFYRERGKAGG